MKPHKRFNTKMIYVLRRHEITNLGFESCYEEDDKTKMDYLNMFFWTKSSDWCCEHLVITSLSLKEK